MTMIISRMDMKPEGRKTRIAEVVLVSPRTARAFELIARPHGTKRAEA